jgi:TrpR-related protein YerC/YecD
MHYIELKSMSQRYQVAIMLEKGRVYSEIASETGASTATIKQSKPRP